MCSADFAMTAPFDRTNLLLMAKLDPLKAADLLGHAHENGEIVLPQGIDNGFPWPYIIDDYLPTTDQSPEQWEIHNAYSQELAIAQCIFYEATHILREHGITDWKTLRQPSKGFPLGALMALLHQAGRTHNPKVKENLLRWFSNQLPDRDIPGIIEYPNGVQ
jgi:hypothetical protein